MEPQPDDLGDLVAELSQLLLAEESLDSTLRRTADLAVRVIPTCDSCGVSMAVEGRVGTRVATSDVARRIDERQYAADEGPCLAAVRSGEVVRCESVATEVRWPRYRQEAALEGLVSSYSIPLLVREKVVGALNLYSRSDPFGEADERAAYELATHAAVTLANAQAYAQTQALVGHLNEALKSRDLIGQAKGIIMERERCSPERAFEILRSVSQRANLKLRDVAQEVVDTGAWQVGEP